MIYLLFLLMSLLDQEIKIRRWTVQIVAVDKSCNTITIKWYVEIPNNDYQLHPGTRIFLDNCEIRLKDIPNMPVRAYIVYNIAHNKILELHFITRGRK